MLKVFLSGCILFLSYTFVCVPSDDVMRLQSVHNASPANGPQLLHSTFVPLGGGEFSIWTNWNWIALYDFFEVLKHPWVFLKAAVKQFSDLMDYSRLSSNVWLWLCYIHVWCHWAAPPTTWTSAYGLVNYKLLHKIWLGFHFPNSPKGPNHFSG